MRKLLSALASALVLVGSAHSALVDRGGGMVYDTTLNITWMSDWNYVVTSGYAASNVGGSGSHRIQANGVMGWDAANDWANDLVFGGFSDWRLPSALNGDGSGPCANFNCTSSEMGHMYYNNWGAVGGGILGGNAYSLGTNAANLALFTNVQVGYWLETEYAPIPDDYSWAFLPTDGGQGVGWNPGGFYATAVRTGDVVTAVPEPATFSLAVIALVGIAAARKRRHVALTT